MFPRDQPRGFDRVSGVVSAPGGMLAGDRWGGRELLATGHRRVRCSPGTTERDFPTALTCSRQDSAGWYGCGAVPHSLVFEARPTLASIPLTLCDLRHVT